MRVTINDEEREVPEQMTLEALIHHLALAPERLAVERNRHVVRRADWPHTTGSDDERIEIIHFVGGGIR